MIKKEIRILGIDDAPFEKKKRKGKCKVIGTIFRGASYMDGLISFEIKVDGNDATKRLIEAVKRSKHKNQLKVIMINGITLGGFNVLDIKKINKETGLPVIVVTRKKPNLEKIFSALKKVFKDWKRRKKKIERAGEVRKIEIQLKKRKGSLFFQFSGLNEKKVREIIKLSCVHALFPEPLRIAHIIGSGMMLGENKTRA